MWGTEMKSFKQRLGRELERSKINGQCNRNNSLGDYLIARRQDDHFINLFHDISKGNV
jgi:hypothetical protein